MPESTWLPLHVTSARCSQTDRLPVESENDRIWFTVSACPRLCKGGDCTDSKPDLGSTFLGAVNVGHTSARTFLSVGNMRLAKVFLIFQHQGAPAKALCALILPVHCAQYYLRLNYCLSWQRNWTYFLRQCDLHTKLARVAIWMDTPAAALMAASAWLLSKHQIPINTRNVYLKSDILYIYNLHIYIHYLVIYL